MYAIFHSKIEHVCCPAGHMVPATETDSEDEDSGENSPTAGDRLAFARFRI